MKLFRFMSKEEFNKYLKGEKLINETKHIGYTNSKGFCFMNLEDYEPEYAYQFLSGIVSTGVCAVFETNEILTKSYGRYAEPYGRFFDSFVSDEYCIEEYEPEYAYQFLSGIVSTGVCAVFEKNEILTKSYGRYAEPYGRFFDSFVSDEYCIEEYSNNDFKLIKYCYDFEEKWYQDKEWKWHHEV